MLTYFNNLDQTILFFIQTNFHIPILNKVMILSTVAGNMGFIWILSSLLLLINKKTRYIGMVTLGALILSTIMGEGILKHIIQRPRPYVDFPSIHLLAGKSTTYSFPSGHTTTSFAAAYVLTKYLKKFSLIIWIVAITIAFSRVYLFMHYPSDIIAGIVLGLICGKVILYVYEHKIKNKLMM
ncbi:phosphatase PAP2 family protein [Dehalobacterium formicoaceticum]|uniref:phosphatase PAP2 family protein n=1 Tax=Dehalobacterium formicoaceticum TaxID=51515 RepID=UPI0031F6656C